MRDELLQLPPHKMSDVAAFCNNYPNIDVAYEIADSDSITAGDAVNMIVKLEREVDDDDDDDAGSRNFGQVNAPRYPKSKTEGWWLVVGDVERNTLMSIKRVTLQQRAQSKLDFVAPDEPGEYTLQIFLMSDSFLGCDQQYEVTLSVGEAESEDEGEDEDDGIVSRALKKHTSIPGGLKTRGWPCALVLEWVHVIGIVRVVLEGVLLVHQDLRRRPRLSPIRVDRRLQIAEKPPNIDDAEVLKALRAQISDSELIPRVQFVKRDGAHFHIVRPEHALRRLAEHGALVGWTLDFDGCL